MSKMLILVGIPCSGKTTFALRWVRENDNRVRVNKDEIRAIHGIRWGEHGLQVTKTEDEAIKLAMRMGFDIVVDDTNIYKQRRDELRRLASMYGYEVETNVFNTPLSVCLERNRLRQPPLPESAIVKAQALKQI